MAFNAFLRHIREVTLGAYAHENIPFEQMVEKLNPQRSLSRNPIFQVMLIFQNAPASELALPNIQVSLGDAISEWATFDLLLSWRKGVIRLLEY